MGKWPILNSTMQRCGFITQTETETETEAIFSH